MNIVTGMILDYRAFDTFGESNVLFIATITVLILLRIDKKEKKEGDSPDTSMTQSEAEANDRIYEPKNDLILQKVAGFLVPLIMIFGIYVILNGHLSPGGGFFRRRDYRCGTDFIPECFRLCQNGAVFYRKNL